MADFLPNDTNNHLTDTILRRISDLRKTHNWTEYQLAQKSGIPQSTISSWARKQIAPTLPSLGKICAAFDITLAQFFTEKGNWTEITPDQRELLTQWEALSDTQKKAFLSLMKSVINQ